MLYLLLILYCAWAFYAGYQFLSGRSLWLDDDAVLNRVVKLVEHSILSILSGNL